MDPDNDIPRGFDLTEIVKLITVISINGDELEWPFGKFPGCEFEMDAPPPKTLTMDLIKGVGKESQAVMKVEVSYSAVLKLAGIDGFWRASAADGLIVPLGLARAKELQCLDLGKGAKQQGVIGGQTGSGKSNLTHIIVSTTALLYPPDEVQFYLFHSRRGWSSSLMPMLICPTLGSSPSRASVSSA